MKDDVRDRALGETLSRAVAGLEPADRLPEVRRRGSRRRSVRWIAVVSSIAVFAGGLGWAALRHEPGAHPASDKGSTGSDQSQIRGHRVPRLGRCPIDRDVASHSAALPGSRPLEGDIDRDGQSDFARVVDVPRFPDSCSRFVVVREASGNRFAARLPEWWAPQIPKVAAFARIDTAPGADIVVTFDAGGFSRQVALFSIRDGKLVALKLPDIFIVADARREAANLDCAGPNEIVWSTSGRRSGPTTDVLRLFYRLHGTRFQLEPPKTQRLRVPTGSIGTSAELSRTERIASPVPELSRLDVPFPSCRV